MKKLGRVMKHDIIKGLLNSFLNNCQQEETILRNGSDFVFESVDLLSYYVHKTSLKRGKWCIKSAEWVINKIATINPKNKDNKCFQNSIIVALNHQNIESHPERISNIKPFIDQYNWEGIEFLAGIKDWKKFEQNNNTIALNILFIPHNEKTINLANESKYSRKRKTQVLLLMITNGEQWHYIALKCVRTDDGFNRPIRSLSWLFSGITANHHGDFYCLNCLHSFRTDNSLKRHEKLCDNDDYCDVEMPTKNKTLKYNHGEKSLKVPFTIYADLHCLLIKQQSCQNNPNESYTERKAMHEPCGYALSLVCSFDKIKNKHNFYRGRDCMKRFCSDLKELVTKIVNYEEKEMIPLTDKENKLYEEQEKCHICQKEFCYDKNEKKKFKIYQKVRGHCYYTGKFRGAAHSICNLNYKVPQEISVKIHNGSTYDYHFLGENTEKYISFSVPI